MIIQIGKRYVTRAGEISGPVALREGLSSYPFQAHANGEKRSYTEGGRYSSIGPTMHDLVSEYIDPTAETKATELAPDKGGRSGFAIVGKKIRVVFKEGRDLNIFNCQSMNVDGQWWRIEDGEGRHYVIDPEKVNYTETK